MQEIMMKKRCENNIEKKQNEEFQNIKKFSILNENSN